MSGRRGSTKGFYTTNPAAADGRLYFGTSNDIDYCVEAATGKTVWQRKLSMTSGRIVIGGVLLRAGSDLVGIDADTGQTRWRLEDAGSLDALPLRWEVDGAEYILSGNASGQIVCVRPADGKVMWRLEGAGNNRFTMSVEGPYLLCNGHSKTTGSLSCYRLGLDGAESHWAISPKTFQYRPKAAPAAAHDGWAFVRMRRPTGLAVVELRSGKIAQKLPYNLGASGFVQWTDGHVLLQPDGSHSRTPLLWYDVNQPAKARRLNGVWDTAHKTTSSYYPILISHALADGRVFIRGARGIHCYDLRQ
jgi:hypothetical protein